MTMDGISGWRAFQTGIACGLMLIMPIAPAFAWQGPSSVFAVVPSIGTAAAGVQNDPADDFIALQEEIALEIFGDAGEAGTAFVFDTEVNAPGYYTGTNYNGLPVDFDVILVIDMDLQNNEPAAHAMGATVYMAAGTLYGQAGSIQVACGVVDTGTFTLDDDPLVIPFDVLSDEEYETFDFVHRQQERLFFSLDTMEASNEVPQLSSDAELWTLDGGATTFIEGLNEGGPSDQQACIDAAYAAYDIAVDAAQDQAAVCLSSATVRWLACTSGCMIGFVIPLFGSVGASICILGCLGDYTLNMAVCSANLIYRPQCCTSDT